MGMHDIVKGITVYCPQCGEIIEDEFQTKSFTYPSLHTYKVGDKVPMDRDDDEYIEIHTICGICNLFTGVYINVVNDILTDKFN